MKLTKTLIALLLAALLAFSVLPAGVLAAQEGENELLLATISDIHYYPESLALYKGEAFYTYLRGANCPYDTLNGVLDSAFDSLAKAAKEQGLKYVVACGDLTTNGEYEAHVALAEKFRRFEQDTGIQVFVLNGNHDINNSLASEFTSEDGLKHPARTTTAAEFYEIYHEFGYDDADAVFSAPDTGKAGALSYALSVDGYRLIIFDAGKYSEDNTAKQRNEHETGGHLVPEVLDWVREQAETAKKNGEVPLAFTHWNASEMNYMHGEVMTGFVIDDAYRLQETLADMGIHYYFSGHQHVSDIDVTYSDVGEPLYSIITPTLTQFPFCYRLTDFKTDASGSVTADFKQIECDNTKIVESDQGAMYLQPFRTSGFNLQHGNGSPAEYLVWMAKGILYNYIADIRKAGSIVQFLKDDFDLDVEAKLNDLIGGGFSIGGTEIFTIKNVMSFIADLDRQIMDTYIYDTTRLWDAISSAIGNLMQFKMSDVPCTKFMEEYGFGDPDAPGTLGDVLYSVIAYMYYGNEDISDDAFMQDVLKNVSQPAFVDRLLAALEQYIVEDFVVNEVLDHLYVHIDSVFNGKVPYVAGFIQFMYLMASAMMHENVFSVSSAADFANKMFSTISLITSQKSSYKVLLETVLGTGYVKYGKNVKELAYYFINQYFDQNNKEATAEQIRVVLEGDVTDDDKDWDVTYSYTGPEAVTPTVEDMQLPSDLTVRYEADSLVFHWLTKYSVTGSDIRIAEKESGKAVAEANIAKETAADTYTGIGFSFGSFGLMPSVRDINVHTVTVSALTPGKTYVYQVGDAEKDFWSPSAEIRMPSADDGMTFVYLADYAASTPARAEAFAKVFKAAAAEKNADFALLSGSSALNGKDDKQFSMVLNAAAETFASLPIYYVPGAGDTAETPNVVKHYNTPSADQYNNDALGCFYSYNAGNAHIVLLNTNDLADDGTLSKVQTRWLEEDLAASHLKWKIIATDAAALMGADRNEALAAQLLDLAEKYAVDLILEGSPDAYYHTYMIRGTEYLNPGDTYVKKIDGTVYQSLASDGVVAVSPGTAGSTFAEAAADAARYKAAAAQGAPVYSAISVYENDITVNTYAVGADGAKTLTQSFAITKVGDKLKLGDVDADGKISSADARLALRYSVKLETFTREQKLAADVDQSRSITASDARAILRASVNLEKIDPEYLEYYQKDLDAIDF